LYDPEREIYNYTKKEWNIKIPKVDVKQGQELRVPRG